MSAVQFKQVNFSLSTLVDQIDMGTIGLPDIQRPFVWKTVKVRDLFDSMYRDTRSAICCSGRTWSSPGPDRSARTGNNWPRSS